jgi:hypothetical protein
MDPTKKEEEVIMVKKMLINRKKNNKITFQSNQEHQKNKKIRRNDLSKP